MIVRRVNVHRRQFLEHLELRYDLTDCRTAPTQQHIATYVNEGMAVGRGRAHRKHTHALIRIYIRHSRQRVAESLAKPLGSVAYFVPTPPTLQNSARRVKLPGPGIRDLASWQRQKNVSTGYDRRAQVRIEGAQRTRVGGDSRGYNTHVMHARRASPASTSGQQMRSHATAVQRTGHRRCRHISVQTDTLVLQTAQKTIHVSIFLSDCASQQQHQRVLKQLPKSHGPRNAVVLLAHTTME